MRYGLDGGISTRKVKCGCILSKPVQTSELGQSLLTTYNLATVTSFLEVNLYSAV